MRSCTIPIVGLPNVGKSTLMNSLVGDKISTITNKPHTTQSLINANKIFGDTQCIFVDTPGFEKVDTKLSKLIFALMKQYLSNLDKMLLVIDARAPKLHIFQDYIHKSIVVINKIDLVRKPKLLPLIANLQQFNPIEIFMVSARSGDGVDELSKYISQYIVQNAHEDVQFQPQNIEDFACACVREKILQLFDQEIPYKVWIEPQYVHVPKNSAWKMTLNIIVPKINYKPMFLANHGAIMRSIGSSARMEIGMKLQQPGYLKLNIVVDKRLWEKNKIYQKLCWIA
jgi:GTP-binding protein Era